MLRRSLPALVLGLALFASSLAGGLPPASAATGLPAGVSNFALVSSTATTATVSWTALDDPNRRGFAIYVVDDALGFRGAVGVSNAARQATVSALTPGRAHTLYIGAYGDLGGSAASQVSVTPVESVCAGRSACVGVDASATVGAIRRAGNGYLHGLTAATDPARVTALKPKAWRVPANDITALTRARQTGAEVTAELSVAWHDATMTETRGGALPPWMVWEFYSWWVETMVSSLVATGNAPTYWEIQNEPGVGSYYAPGDVQTREQLLQQFKVAHDAIRRVLPTAKIIGPSLGSFTPINDSAILDLRTFIEYSVANNLKFDAISWHEIGNGQFATFDADPKSILSHVASVRALLADAPGFGQPKIFLNEYGAAWWQLMPGATVGYFAAMEEAGVDAGNLTCDWHDGRDACGSSDGSIDALLQADNSTPTDAYWTHETLAGMTGSRVRSSATDPAQSVLATSATNGAITILVGRHWGCLPWVTEHCAATSALPAYSATDLVVKLPAQAAKQYRVVVRRNPETTGPVPTLVTAFDQTMSPSGGQLVIPLAAIADGEAVDVRITPSENRVSGSRR